MKTALLLSGGMDSLSLAWWKRPDIAFTFDYGQLAAEAEIAASKAICKRLCIQHYVDRVDCRAFGSGDMAGTDANRLAPATDWWPFRNQLLITLAAMRAVSLGVSSLWLGTVKTDNCHGDGTADFIDAINRLTSCQKGGLQIAAPAIALSTQDLIRLSELPPGVLAWAHSCHTANVACGCCRGCNKYFEVFADLGYDLDRVG